MSQRYVFIFTNKRIVIVAVAVVMNALLLVVAGILIGLQIYPKIATSGPKRNIPDEKWTTKAPLPLPPAPKKDSTLAYEMNTIKYSEKEAEKHEGTRYYTIELGKFAGTDRAAHRGAELRKIGIKTYIFTTTDKNKQWYSVRAGIFDNAAAARRTSKHIRKKLGVQPTVCPFGAE